MKLSTKLDLIEKKGKRKKDGKKSGKNWLVSMRFSLRLKLLLILEKTKN